MKMESGPIRDLRNSLGVIFKIAGNFILLCLACFLRILALGSEENARVRKDRRQNDLQ